MATSQMDKIGSELPVLLRFLFSSIEFIHTRKNKLMLSTFASNLEAC